ncbi:MAG: pirin family protein [Pseudomonadota bacterium]
MWNPLLDPSIPIGDSVDQIETVIVPRARDLGGFEVRRALPSAERQMVGPFIFFDQMGPAEFLTGQGIDVRPHPHIGLGTVTYLLKGKMHHRDSLGSDLWIEPGAVNWMMAGQGITHSERTDGEARKAPLSLFGLQTWLALPKDREEDAAGFAHLERAALPELEGEGKQVRLILGTAWGEKVGLDMPSEVFYADARLQPGASIPLPDDHEDRGVYILDGEVSSGGQTFEAGQYETLAGICAAILAHYPIAHIAGHEHIAAGRKQDPGSGFDWAQLQQSLSAPDQYFPAAA